MLARASASLKVFYIWPDLEAECILYDHQAALAIVVFGLCCRWPAGLLAGSALCRSLDRAAYFPRSEM